MRRVGLIFASLLISCGWSRAADLVAPLPPEPPPPLVSDFTPLWDGPYIGVLAGYASAQGAFTGCFCGWEAEHDFAGGRVGLFAGRNWIVPQGYMLGIDADLGYDQNARVFGGNTHIGTDLFGSIRLRVGYPLGNALMFGAAGWTATKAFVEEPDDYAIARGTTVGAGVDWALTHNMFVRAEYRYNEFGSVNLAGVDTDFGQHAVNLGLAFRF